MNNDKLDLSLLDAPEVARRKQIEGERLARERAALAAAEASRIAEERDPADRAAALAARTPKQKHDDEIAGQRAYIDDPKAASYFWAAVKDGAVTVEWSQECNCDDRADHDELGHTKKLDAFPAKPFTFAAFPIGAGFRDLPTATELLASGHVYEIGIGDEPVWIKEGSQVVFQDTSPDMVFHALIYGVRHADGSEELTTIDHVANIAKHADLQTARAHAAREHSPNAPSALAFASRGPLPPGR